MRVFYNSHVVFKKFNATMTACRLLFSFKIRDDMFQIKYRCMYNIIDVHIIVLFDLMIKATYLIYPQSLPIYSKINI